MGLKRLHEENNGDEVDEFDEAIQFNIESDVCRFCRQGQIVGVKMDKKLAFDQEIDDADENFDENDSNSDDENQNSNNSSNHHSYHHQANYTEKTPSSTSSCYYSDENSIWISKFSLKSNGATIRRRFVHYYCALFSPLIWYDGKKWYNVRKEISRSEGLCCHYCKSRGASLGCYCPKCSNVAHISCAIFNGFLPGRANVTNKYYCEEHRKIQCEEESEKIDNLCNDLSRGREQLAIKYNFHRDHNIIFNEFEYITKNVDSNDIIASIQNINDWPYCECKELCNDINTCQCLSLSQRNYTMHGILIPGGKKPILECNMKCNCSLRRCTNRVVYKGIQYQLELYRKIHSSYSSSFSKPNKKIKLSYDSPGKVWGVRTLDEIPEGAFVCEVVGQYVMGYSKIAYHCKDGNVLNDGSVTNVLLNTKGNRLIGSKNIHIIDQWEDDQFKDDISLRYTDANNEEEENDDKEENSMEKNIDYEGHYFQDPDTMDHIIDIQSYMPPLPTSKEIKIFLNQTLCMDCRFFGNISRFIRKRRKQERKMFIQRLVYDNQNDMNYPRLALFAAHVIAAGTELIL